MKIHVKKPLTIKICQEIEKMRSNGYEPDFISVTPEELSHLRMCVGPNHWDVLAQWSFRELRGERKVTDDGHVIVGYCEDIPVVRLPDEPLGRC